MSMKLSYRDKVIIIIVSVLIVIGVGIFCFIKPKYEELQVSNDRLAAKQEEQANIQARIDTLEGLKETLKNNVKMVVDTQEEFVNEKEYGQTQQISQYIKENIFSDIKDKITSINVPNLSEMAVDPYVSNQRGYAYEMKMNADIGMELPEEDYNEWNNSYPQGAESAYTSGVNINVALEYDEYSEVLDIVNRIAEHEKHMYLVSVSFPTEEDEQTGADGAAVAKTVNFVIRLYEVYPMDPDAVDK